MHKVLLSSFHDELWFSFLTVPEEQSPKSIENAELLFKKDIKGLSYEAYLCSESKELDYSFGHFPLDIGLDESHILCDLFGETWSLFSNSSLQKIQNLLPSYLKPNWDNSVFYGGSFRPWHDGHSECVFQAIQNGYRVIICPDRNPWKSTQQYNENPLDHLVSVIEKIKDVGEASVYPGFLALKEKNPTVDWIKKLEKSRRKLLMGDDSFLSMHKWKRSDGLIQLLDTIIVVPRLATKEQRERQISRLIKLNPKIKIQVLKKHPFEHISSTEIRKIQGYEPTH